MRWTNLDSFLLFIVSLSVVLATGGTARLNSACDLYCYTITWFCWDATARIQCHKQETPDCAPCVQTNSLCVSLPTTTPYCCGVAGSMQKHSAANCGLACALNPTGYAQANPGVVIGNPINAGFVFICQAGPCPP